MASFNKIIIVGNLGKDPETRYLPDGSAITNLSVATSEQWKDKATGEKKEAVEWWRVACFGRLAEIAGEYLKKGSSVLIEGRGRTNKYTDKDGNERYSFQVIAGQLQMLGSKSEKPSDGDSGEPKAEAKPAAAKKPAGQFDDMEDDIPF